MESVELRTIVPILQNLSVGELETLSKHISKVRGERTEQRRKELWGNVRAAIRKYCSEFNEDIETRGCDEEGTICLDQLDDVGVLYIDS